VNWDQLRTLLWLRWRLARNQWGRGGQLNAVITMVVAVIGLAAGLVGGVGGIVGGALALARVSPMTVMFVWDGLIVLFLFFWMMGLVSELQRSEMIDLSRLLHLPVSLLGVFLLNYFSCLLSLSLALMLPGMLGLCVGLVLSRGFSMVLLIPLVLGFFFMVTAWTYYLQGWLASLMVNQRRRRAIIMGITAGFILLAQLPNLLTNVWFGRNHSQRHPGQAAPAGDAMHRFPGGAGTERLIRAAHWFVPVLWVPQGAKSLAEGAWWPALWGAGGMIALGALGLQGAYRSTLRFYQGADQSKAARRPALPRAARAGRRLLVERSLPFVPAEVAGLALATFRSMTRAPEVKMALGMNVVLFAMLGAGALFRGPGAIPEVLKPFMAGAAVLITFLGLMQVLFNQFGFDRDGFRALVLLPAPRRHLLMGKNLALLPLAMFVFAVFLVLLTVLAHLPPPEILGACLQFIAAFFLLSAVGNLTSILVPYRISAGSLKPTKTKATTVLMLMGVNLTLPFMMAPILVPAGLGLLCEHLGWLPGTLVTLASSVVLAALAAVVYWFTLEPLGALLQRREQRILQIVTTEVE
jgi:ABC-2 type transport system permease protein